MKKFVKITSVLLCFVMLISLAVFTSCSKNNGKSEETTEEPITKRTIKLAVLSDDEPFSFYKEDIIAGINIDILAAYAEYINADLEIKDVSKEEILNGLINGDYEGAVVDFVPDDAELAAKLSFSSPIFAERDLMIVRAGSSIYSTKDLPGKVIGVIGGSSTEALVTEQFGTDNVKAYDNIEDIAKAADNGDIDVAIVDEKNAEKVRVAGESLLFLNEDFFNHSYTLCTLNERADSFSSISTFVLTVTDEQRAEIIARYAAE